MAKRLLITPNLASRRRAQYFLDHLREVPPSRRGALTPTQARSQGITSGVSQARKIAAGKPVDAYQVRRFFTRFRGKHAAALGTPWKESRMRQSWDAWGGSPFRTQTTRAIDQHERKERAAKKRAKKAKGRAGRRRL